jgi:hypothetical protein
MSEIRVDVIKDELGTGAPSFPTGNVGIGVVPSAWAGFKGIQVQQGALVSNQFSAGNLQTIVSSNLFYDGAYKYVSSDAASYYNQVSGSHVWYNAPSGTAGAAAAATERMRIDSSGRLTTPSQPMFLGRPSVDYSGGGMPNAIIAFTSIHNNGSHFNAANSRFTAPVTGWYLTTWGGLQLAASVTSLMKNGVRLHQGNHYNVATPTYITMTQTAIEYLNAGDYLNVEGWNGGGYFSTWYLWSVTLLG